MDVLTAKDGRICRDLRFFFLLVLLAMGIVASSSVRAEETDWLDDDIYAEFAEDDRSASYDPLEPLNRFFFAFNDKLYFWILKPINTAYRAVFPQDVRLCIDNFFENLKAPIYLVNNLAQGKFREGGTVLLRFAINSTLGVYGLGDPAATEFHLASEQEDFGQTLGYWGAGEGIYICWPFLGPSNIRDTLGMLVDTALHPLGYLGNTSWQEPARYSVEKVNQLSFHPTLYDDVKKFSLDPYVTIRQAFYDLRYEKIADSTSKKQEPKPPSIKQPQEKPELASR